MRIFNDLSTWQQFRKTLPNQGLGFVPTMGNLHQGHLSLLIKSRQANQYTAASIFVNPTQFNQSEDFKNYPRTLAQDLKILEEAGTDFCLLPQEESIYPDQYHYQLQENHLSKIMEGFHRPGHFNGVLTVVMKLLNLVKPQTAYFGEKDYQQYRLIKDMVHAFFMEVCIEPCPTIREASGLAYSSRNNRFTSEERSLAECFAQIFHQQDKSCAAIKASLKEKQIPVEYIEEHEGRRLIAVYIGAIRLIDNYELAVASSN